ncbi:MAG: hypothetical protein AAB364_00130 [Patescibacteria group bacterium]
MQKIINVILKVILSLILVMPILGTLGIFPAPTADLYQSTKAFQFIEILMAVQYINIIMAIVFALAVILLWTKRVALAALLILPITVNIVAFHLVLDGGLFTTGAIMADVLLALNIYFLWQQREHYAPLFKSNK